MDTETQQQDEHTERFVQFIHLYTIVPITCIKIFIGSIIFIDLWRVLVKSSLCVYGSVLELDGERCCLLTNIHV